MKMGGPKHSRIKSNEEAKMGDFQMIIQNPQGGNFLRRIEWNKETFSARVKEIANRYKGELQISTPEDKKKAKADRAYLNSIRTEIDSRRKEIKAAIMEPYDIFEAEVKEGTAQLDAVAAAIDEQIKAYETREKEEKIKQIREYWENHKDRPGSRGPLQELTSWERIQNPKWVNASYTIKKACEEIDAAFSEAISNLQSIEQIDDDRTIKDIMVNKLVETGSLRAAYDVQAKIHQQEKIRREQQEREEKARREADEQRARARREAEEAEQKKKAQDTAAERLEAMRARLAVQQAAEPEGGTSDAGTEGNEATAAESNENMPAAGDAGRAVASPDNQNTTCDDAQGYAGQDPRRAQEEKIYKAQFWVAGTKEQLKALADYIKDIGLAGYGTIK